jgi:hypothetical protein
MFALHKRSAILREMPTNPVPKIFSRLLGIRLFSFAGIECRMSLRPMSENS